MHGAIVVGELQCDVTSCEAQPAHGVDAMRIFRGFRFQKTSPCGCVEKQFGDRDCRAKPCADRLRWLVLPAFRLQPKRARCALRPTGDRQPRHRRNRRQRLAAKAKTGHRLQVIKGGDLRRGMPRYRQWQLRNTDAAPVVGHLHQHRATASQLHLDGTRAAIHRVLQQFLERGGGPFDDLARCNLIDQMIG